MTIITESIPKPSGIRRRISQLRKSLADLEFLLPIAERVHESASADDSLTADESRLNEPTATPSTESVVSRE